MMILDSGLLFWATLQIRPTYTLGESVSWTAAIFWRAGELFHVTKSGGGGRWTERGESISWTAAMVRPN